jgi:hypothetical protein
LEVVRRLLIQGVNNSGSQIGKERFSNGVLRGAAIGYYKEVSGLLFEGACLLSPGDTIKKPPAHRSGTSTINQTCKSVW